MLNTCKSTYTSDHLIMELATKWHKTPQKTFNCFSDALRRLDDKEDTVRALGLDIVSAVPTCINSEDVGLPETQAFVEHASKMILLHADDSDKDIRKKCIGTIFRRLLL